MTSPSLKLKIANAKAAALQERPKATLCANVILAGVDGDVEGVKLAVVQLKKGLGHNWSPLTALQFMSGRRGAFACDYASDDGEKARLQLAHIVARQVCSEQNLGSVSPPDGTDLAKLASLVEACKKHLK